MENTELLIVLFITMIAAVVGQGPLGRFTESTYYGTVYRHQPQHTRIVQLTVEPIVVSGSSNPPSLQEVIYFSNDIDSQFYLHSQTGNVMVDAMELTEGNYTFSACANYTVIISGTTVTMESLSVMVVIRVLPEFYFVGTEQDGSYLAYVSTNAPVGTHVTRIIPQYTFLNETMFSYSIDGVESDSLSVNFDSNGSLELTHSSNSAGVLHFVAVCSATDPSSSDVIETLRVPVTIVFYQLSDLQPSNLTFNSTNGLITWIPPSAANNYQNLLPLANYDIRIDVVNGDDNYTDGPDILSSSTNSFTYQPLIPQARLWITLIAAFVRGISGSMTINTIVTATGVVLQPPQAVNISGDSVAGRLIIRWQPPPSPPVNIMGYAIRLSYTARLPHSNISVFKELMQSQSHNILLHEFNQLPGDTLYNVVVVALYSNGQRVPTSAQHTLTGYAPSDAPDIVETEFMPPSTIRITWNTLFFSNGDITNYTVQFVDMFNDSLTVHGNNASHSRDMFGSSPFVNVTVRASNQYGDGPRSVSIVSTRGGASNIAVENITDSSACFVWSPPPNARPLTYAVLINNDEVALLGMGQTAYCETQIASDSLTHVNILASYLRITYGSSRVSFHTVRAPYNFTAFSPTNVSVTLEWSPPEPINAIAQGIHIQRYELNIAPSSGPYPLNVIGGNSSVFDDFLQPGMTYTVTLVAVYSNNARAKSLPTNFTTLVNVPPSISPRNLIISSYNTTSTLAVFQWDPVYFSNGPITGYRLYIGDGDGIFAQGVSNTTLEVSVRSDVEISVRVVAINSAGEGSPIVRVFSLNAAPGALRIFVLNVSSIRLFWDPPALFIVDFMHYLLNVSINGVTVNSVIVDANSHVYNGLSTISSSVYSFQVVAVYPSASSSSNMVSIEIAAVCDSPCPFGGQCVAEPNVCDCTSVSNTTGGTNECYGGRANASCDCVCYDELFTGETCTEPLYGPTVLILESSMHNVMVTVIPPTPVVSTADIMDYRLSISGPLEDQEYTLLEDMRSVMLNLSVENFSYTVTAQTRFRISEHHNNFIFTAPSNPVTLTLYECGPNMYGGFNNSDCQSCPENSGNSRGYNYISASCGCSAGYTGQDGGPCIACSAGTFKPVNGSGTCQYCPLTLSSEPASAVCSCASGHEPSETRCTACAESFYKDNIGNATCKPCPPFSGVLATGSNTLSNCTCVFSSGTAEQECYAFESKASVQMPSDREISNSWVIISWDPLTSVVDRNGNPLGAVMGFYITYQVVSAKRDAAGLNAVNITDGMATSVNLTGLQQDSQYDVEVSPYIEGFQLGPPTTIMVNTLSLVDGNTTMVTMATMTSTVSLTITPTASTPADNGGSSDEVLSMMMIIIIAAAGGGAIIILLLIVCCCIMCTVYRRKRSNKATISESTKKMMEEKDNSLTPIFKKVVDQEMNVLANPSFVDESTQKEHVFDVKEDTTCTEYVYEDIEKKPQQKNVYTGNYYVQEKGNSDKTNQLYEIERLATPDDYGNEALYEEMTARYFDICQSNQLKLPEVSRNKMTLLEQLGEGEFGRVMKGVASGIINGEPETVVAVKQLKEGASNDDKKNFLGEANLMLQFSHPNILTLLGVVTIDEPVLVIIPFMKNGDLQSFLSKSSQSAQLTYQDKLNISVQVASGMEYLAARFFIHRDLAARNVLVGDQLHVKISDFGLSRALQDDTYYKLTSTAKLPVKWMALESIEYRKFSTFSDVWSYGVVLWEIFSLGAKPYKGVPPASMPTYIRSGKRLAKPADCTDEIYQLMTQCWLVQKDSRPTFTKLKMEITELLNKEKS